MNTLTIKQEEEYQVIDISHIDPTNVAIKIEKIYSEEIKLDPIEYTPPANKSCKKEPKKKRNNSKYTDTERYLIGKHAAENGPAAAVRTFNQSHPHLRLGESMARHLRDKYKGLLKNGETTTKLSKAKTGRPLLLGDVDEEVRKYLIDLHNQGQIVNREVAVETAKTIIARSGDESLKSLDIKNSSWARSILTRLGFVKHVTKTTKKSNSSKTADKIEKKADTKKVEHSTPSMVMDFQRQSQNHVAVDSTTR